MEVVAPAGQQVVGDDVEQETDLVGGPVPVLGGEGVDGEPGDPELEGALGGVEEGLLPRPVTLGPRQAALLSPPAVAVHDTGHVDGHPMRVEPFEVHPATVSLAARAPEPGTRRPLNGLGLRNPAATVGSVSQCRGRSTDVPAAVAGARQAGW